MTKITQRKPYYRLWGQLVEPSNAMSRSFFDAALNNDDIPRDGEKRGVAFEHDEFTTTDKHAAEARLCAMKSFVEASGHTFEFTLQEVIPE
jgi:pyruvoyl-dependent arginine decarboxylase (PvlArgDC)